MKELHYKVINREITYKPLLVNVKPKKPIPGYTVHDMMRDPTKALEHRIAALSETIKVKSDFIPFVESNFIETLIPSIFGAQVHVAPGGSVDVRPCFKDIHETENIRVDDIFRGETENAVRHLEFLKNNAPDYLYISPTRPMSPLDNAVVLRGSDFYADLLAEPELSIGFMEKIADVTIETIKCFKRIMNQPLDECLTIRGHYFPGIRVSGDAVVNLSPAMIENIMCPFYKKFGREFGCVMLHYCCTPAPSTHVAPALAKGGGISAVDNWQGYKTILNREDYFQETLGVCTDAKKEDILDRKIFNDEFVMFGGRPLIVSVNVDSADEGLEVYDIWRKNT